MPALIVSLPSLEFQIYYVEGARCKLLARPQKQAAAPMATLVVSLRDSQPNVTYSEALLDMLKRAGLSRNDLAPLVQHMIEDVKACERCPERIVHRYYRRPYQVFVLPFPQKA